MRSILAKAFIGLAIASIGMFGANNEIGTWKMNVAKSKFTPADSNPIKSQTLVRQAIDGGSKGTGTGERQDGTAINWSYSVKYDGKEYPVTGAAWDTISVKQKDANTFTVELKKTGGKYHTTGRSVISKDGKTNTITAKGTNAEGQPTSRNSIYEKQ